MNKWVRPEAIKTFFVFPMFSLSMFFLGVRGDGDHFKPTEKSETIIKETLINPLPKVNSILRNIF